jgi:hypothetical protein
MEYWTINRGAGTLMMASHNFNIWLKGQHMQLYFTITRLPVVRELESLWYMFLDYIDANEDVNADILSIKNLENVKLLPLPQPHSRTRTYSHPYPSAHRATQLMSVLARVYSVSRQNLNTTTVP